MNVGSLFSSHARYRPNFLPFVFVGATYILLPRFEHARVDRAVLFNESTTSKKGGKNET